MGSESDSAGQGNDLDKYLDVDMKSYQMSRSHSNTSYLNTNSVMQLNNFGMQVKTRAFTLIKYKNGDIYYGQIRVEIIQQSSSDLAGANNLDQPSPSKIKAAKPKRKLVRHGLGKFVK